MRFHEVTPISFSTIFVVALGRVARAQDARVHLE